MANVIKEDALSHQILSLLEKGHNRVEIVNSLVAEGHDAFSIKHKMQLLTQKIKGQKREQAISLVIAGACLALISILFALTFVYYPHHTFYTAVYGMASFGALLIMAGLIMIFV